LNHFIKSIVELIKFLIKIAIAFLGLILCAVGYAFVYEYVEEETSSKLIAFFAGFIPLVLIYKFVDKVCDKSFDSTFLKEGGKDDYERALFQSTWGEIFGFCLIALIYGVVTMGSLSLILPDSLMESIFHWSHNSESAGGILLFFQCIGVGALVGILINSHMRETLKNWFK
jgi:hypothetical protein